MGWMARRLQGLGHSLRVRLGLGLRQGTAGPQISDALWSALLQDYPFLGWRSQADRQQLRALCGQFLGDKEFHGTRGFVVSDAIALAVAAQACLPVLHLGLQAYSGFVGIVMHEGPVRAQREWVDDTGLVHTWQETLVGEAMGDGPIMLSWHEGAEPLSAREEGAAFNVVIHEFVHILDGLDGGFDGTPPLPRAQREAWQEGLQVAFDRFDERSACGYPSVLDHYGAQDLVEFFAVSSEAFFTQPWAFCDEQPDLYRLYAQFYRQDPAAYPAPEALRP
jgi:Mlc titration factor MtfA (ptsG expression regulator)